MTPNVLVGGDSVRSGGPIDSCGKLKFCLHYYEICLQYDVHFLIKIGNVSMKNKNT